MKRSAIARKTPLRAMSKKHADRLREVRKELRPRKPMRRSRPKTTPARKSAQGQDCTVCLPGCPNARDTVVLAHLRMFGGGGERLKPPDNEAVYADFYCHERIDGRIPWVCTDQSFNFWEYIARAIIRTQRVMRANGILFFKGEEAA